MTNYSQPKIDVKQKSGSIAFFIAIPLAFGIGLASLFTFIALFDWNLLEPKTWMVFGYGLFGASALFATRILAIVRTFIHEFKHAVMVIVTGNRLTDFQFHKQIGHVTYLMYSNKVRFAPFITLAPYFLPLFSLPALAFCLIAGDSHPQLAAGLLGIAMGTDLTTSYQDFHPYQSDLRRILGGWVVTYAFVIGANFMWITFSLLWMIGKKSAYTSLWDYIFLRGLDFAAFLQRFIERLT